MARQAVQVELIATIATSYYQLEMYDAQIKETRDIVNSWEESVRAQKVLMAVGEATSDEVSMAEASKLEAEAALKKAFYLTNKARAAFYPTLNLSGIIGWTNEADEVVSPTGLLMRTLGSLTQPVFAKGKLIAEVKKAQAEQEVAKIAFHQAILRL